MDSDFIFSDLSRSFLKGEPNLYSIQYERSKFKKGFIDLVNVNWFKQGLTLDEELIEAAYEYAIQNSKAYHPHPLGLPILREAIADWYFCQGLSVDADQIVITPGTSFSYWIIFQLLGCKHSKFLIPTPGYPLFDILSTIANVELRGYSLDYLEPNFDYDSETLKHEVLGDEVAAVILINPHNPTGSETNRFFLSELLKWPFLMRNNLPIVVDEVFHSFRYDFVQGFFERKEYFYFNSISEFPLFFILNGVSKIFAMPSHKIGWILIDGKKELVRDTLKVIEFIMDSFLPVPDITQYAIQYILEKHSTYQKETERISEIVMQRKQFVYEFSQANEMNNLVIPDNGVYAWLLLDENENDECAAIHLLKKNVAVHPGYFYHFSFPCLVFTTLCREDVLKKALLKIAQLYARSV
ncbi:MAG: pyridoxal phosphate-dependent aminotransferase [bacterium]|nr:pyridoxal phosphate-dependent aminotransferase [bacterium]